MKPIHRFTAHLTLAGCLLNSCITSTGAHFKHLGQDGQCILMHQRKDDSLELYRVKDKTYVKGTLTTFHEYNPEWCNSIDQSDSTYKTTTEGAPRQTVYRELELTRYRTDDDRCNEYWNTTDSPLLTELPQDASAYHSKVEMPPHFSLNIKDKGEYRQAIITEELNANLHALYAYPLSAVCYLGIDAPVVIAQGASFLLALPFIMGYEGIKNHIRANQEQPHTEKNDTHFPDETSSCSGAVKSAPAYR